MTTLRIKHYVVPKSVKLLLNESPVIMFKEMLGLGRVFKFSFCGCVARFCLGIVYRQMSSVAWNIS